MCNKWHRCGNFNTGLQQEGYLAPMVGLPFPDCKDSLSQDLRGKESTLLPIPTNVSLKSLL